MADLIGFSVSSVITIAILSYLLGDNPLYRIAMHLLVGVAAGYAAVVVTYNTILPWIGRVQNFDPLAMVGVLLGLLLLLRAFRMMNILGSWVVAYLVGVGAAVAIGGAVVGTLGPQIQATSLSLLPSSFDGAGFEKAADAWVIVLGTLATLGFFYYGARGERGQRVERPLLARLIAPIGQIFIGTAFGAMYAGALLSSIVFFATSLKTLWDTAVKFIGG